MQRIGKTHISALPSLGFGLGYRPELREGILAYREQIDFLEVLADNYLARPGAHEEIEELCTWFPIIPHGVNLSIGSVLPVDRIYLQGIKRICEITHAPYYSEHLCMTRVPGRDIGHLSPLWHTEESLHQVIHNVATVQDILGLPLVLENVTYFLEIPHGTMCQTEFFSRLVEATGCGVLLDVTNVWINAANHHFDPEAFLEQMPLDHLVQVHLAGGYWRGGWLVDSHSERVSDEMFALFHRLVSQCRVKGVIFEHDQHFPPMNVLLAQLGRVREIMGKSAVYRPVKEHTK